MATIEAASPITASVGHFLDTLRALVAREFRMRYKGSSLGIVWALLSPLGTALTLNLVFTRILPLSIPHYVVSVYGAMLPWAWFQSAVQGSATTLMENRDLVRLPFFSKPLLPVVIASTNFLLYLLALPVLFALMLVDGLSLPTALVALPVVWLVQWVLTLSFTMLIAALGIIVRDVQHLMGVIMLLWFYLTPVFYDLNRLPPATARWFVLNPMTAVVEAHRAILLHGELPDWTSLLRVSLVGSVILIISLRIFRTLEDAFIEQT